MAKGAMMRDSRMRFPGKFFLTSIKAATIARIPAMGVAIPASVIVETRDCFPLVKASPILARVKE